MKRIFLQLKQLLRNERGEITFFACFFVVGIVMLISFLLLYASIRITCINIRNGAKMELNNLSGTIYADTYRSQRETNFEEYLNTLYSSSDYTDMLEANRKLFRDSQGSQFHAALWVTQTEPQFLIRQFQLQHFLIGLSGYLMAQKFERVKARHLVQFCHCRNCFVHHRHRITFFVHVGNSFLT